MEQPIIDPIPVELLKKELTPDRQLRMTNKSNNKIYIITAHNAPNVMREIGRLREMAFREAGGGTGKEVDIDEFDTCENCYKQLIVWNPEAEEIIGGYRYLITCPTPSSWAARSSAFLIKVLRWVQKVYLHLTIFGMAWAHSQSLCLMSNTSLAK